MAVKSCNKIRAAGRVAALARPRPRAVRACRFAPFGPVPAGRLRRRGPGVPPGLRAHSLAKKPVRPSFLSRVLDCRSVVTTAAALSRTTSPPTKLPPLAVVVGSPSSVGRPPFGWRLCVRRPCAPVRPSALAYGRFFRLGFLACSGRFAQVSAAVRSLNRRVASLEALAPLVSR